VYTEHISHVLSLLDLSAQSGVLILTPTEHPAEGSWQACCELREGRILTCTVSQTNDQRIIARGELAIAWLRAWQGGMYWQVEERDPTFGQRAGVPDGARLSDRSIRPGRIVNTEDQPRISPSTFGPTAFGPRPRRTLLGQQGAPFQAWPRLQRQVFALIDGERSLAEIARLLANRSFNEVEQTLQELRTAGYIE